MAKGFLVTEGAEVAWTLSISGSELVFPRIEDDRRAAAQMPIEREEAIRPGRN